jgi:hypothetical protein
LSIVFFLGYQTKKPEKITIHTESVVLDSVYITKYDTVRITSQGQSYVIVDTLILKDTVFVDTTYVVEFDTTTTKFSISGKTYFRFNDRSTYKLDIAQYPDTTAYKVVFLQDSLKAMLRLNNMVLVDSSIFVPRIEKELKWYEEKWLWFGAGALSTAGIVYLIK